MLGNLVKTFVFGVLVAGTTSIAFAAPTLATNDHNPRGNNGTVKINDKEVTDSVPNNNPHVQCQFKVDFYGYDKNSSYTANVKFELQAPTNKAGDKLIVTSGNLKPFIGGDAAGGGTDLDASETYKLAFTGTPHPQQGYHVKLTIEADGSQGSKTKHKVFWVKPCVGQVLGSNTSTTNTPGNSPSVNGSTTELPGELPSTGASPLALFFSLIPAGATYLAVLKRKKYLAAKS